MKPPATLRNLRLASRLCVFIATLTIYFTAVAQAQWEIVTPAPTTANLRGVHSIGAGIAWVSGTEGTVLRTEDAGYLWQRCTVPPGAEHLDFRGIQAFDANTAIVMSSGKGDLSRLYKTTDGCQSWKLLFTNPDPEGFFDAISFDRAKEGMLLGDPIAGHFAVFTTTNAGTSWTRRVWLGLEANAAADAVFAASTSSLLMWTFLVHSFFVTGGRSGAYFIECNGELKNEPDLARTECDRTATAIPLGAKSQSSGAFSLSATNRAFVAVGGNYLRPNDRTGTAAYSLDAGDSWRAAQTPPHGYRSSITYDATTKTWITVGPNGTDISTDDGRNWRALKPSPNDAPDADKNWNALSLPFVVGSHGRIGVLKPLKPGAP